jgi:hypothetical protein
LALLILILSCKKDRLTGGNEILVGTWRTIPVGCGCCTWNWTDNPLYKLELLKKGKYRLSQDNKNIEDGRLITVDGFVSFRCDDRKSHFNGKRIEAFNNDTLKIDPHCENEFQYIFVKD